MHDHIVPPSHDRPFRFVQRFPVRPSATSLQQTVQACQYREMENAFRASGGMMSSDAQKLGVSRLTLYNWKNQLLGCEAAPSNTG
ncbi:hypothetical protein [Variovorax sp. V118]|uniref:hypothetical protein n=1 Tax=Variovorax sp. V118 TaxID=3065954 RepID=UPI0034E849DF